MNRRSVAAGILFASLISPAISEPQGGQVRSGSATIQQTLGTTTITQSTQKAILEWQRFNISPTELVKFVQPNETAVILNRVTGGDPSRILGKLQANGQLFLVNPNGILFGPSAKVDVGSLVATTLNISNQDFLSGNYHFTQDSSLDLASVVNQGTIQVSDEGYVVLTAPLVSNEGLIVANLGKIVLGAGNECTLNLDGRRLVSFQLPASPGPDGTVVLTPEAVSEVLRTAMNTPAAATELREENGSVQLVGGSGTLLQAGTLQADGGTILALSDRRTDISGSLIAPGGFVETSSHRQLDFHGSVQAPGGTWLIDPANLTVVDVPTQPNEIAVSNIVTSLNAGTNVILDAQTQGANTVPINNPDFGQSPGTITVAADILKTAGSDATLTLHAGDSAGSIVINHAVGSSSGKLNLVLQAGATGDVTLDNAPITTNGGSFTSTGGGKLTQLGAATLDAGTGTISLTHGGDVTVAAMTGGNATAVSQMGKVQVASLIATGFAGIQSETGIFDGDSGSDDLDVSGSNVTLVSHGIGLGNRLEVVTPGQLFVTTGNQPVQIGLGASGVDEFQVETDGGDISITGSAGDSLSYTAATGFLVALNASGFIGFSTTGNVRDGNGGSTDVRATGANLTAASLGTTADPLELRVSGSLSLTGENISIANDSSADVDLAVSAGTGGVQYAQTGGNDTTLDAFVTSGLSTVTISTEGDLTLYQMNAQGAEVSLTAGGSILDGNPPAVDVRSKNLTLTAGGGIGTTGALEVTLTHSLVTSAGAGGVTSIDLGASNLTVLEVTTTDSDVSVTGTSGDSLTWSSSTSQMSGVNNSGTLSLTVLAGQIADGPGVDAVSGAVTLSARDGIHAGVTANDALRLTVTAPGAAIEVDAGANLPFTTEVTVNDGQAQLTTGGADFLLYKSSLDELSGSNANQSLSFTATGGLVLGSVDPLVAGFLTVVADQGVGTLAQPLHVDALTVTARVTAAGSPLYLVLDSTPQLIDLTTKDGKVHLEDPSTNVLLDYDDVNNALVGDLTGSQLVLSSQAPMLVDDLRADFVGLTTTKVLDEFGSDPGADLIAPSLSLVIGSGIGQTSPPELQGNVLEMQAGLDASLVLSSNFSELNLTSAGGNVTLTGTDSLSFSSGVLTASNPGDTLRFTVTSGSILVDQVTAGILELTSAGSIMENGADAGADILASDATLTAQTGIGGLEISAASLSAGSQAGGLSLASLSATSTSAILAVGGGGIDLSQTGGGSLSVLYAQTAGGPISFSGDGSLALANVSTTGSLTTSAVSTTIASTTYGSLDLTSTGGNVTVTGADQLSYNGTTGVLTATFTHPLKFTTTGSIADGQVGLDLSGPSLELHAVTIGQLDPLEFDSPSLTADALGSISLVGQTSSDTTLSLNSQFGPVTFDQSTNFNATVNSARSGGQDVKLTHNGTGDLLVTDLRTSGLGKVRLVANHGSILDATPAGLEDVVSPVLEIQASGGISPLDALELSVTQRLSLVTGDNGAGTNVQLGAILPGRIQVVTNGGDVQVLSSGAEKVTLDGSGGGLLVVLPGRAVELTTTEAIGDANGAGVNLEAEDVSLTAPSIGAANPLEATVGTRLALSSDGLIGIDLGSTDLTALEVSTLANVTITGSVDQLLYDHSTGAMTAVNQNGSIDFVTDAGISAGTLLADTARITASTGVGSSSAVTAGVRDLTVVSTAGPISLDNSSPDDTTVVLTGAGNLTYTQSGNHQATVQATTSSGNVSLGFSGAGVSLAVEDVSATGSLSISSTGAASDVVLGSATAASATVSSAGNIGPGMGGTNLTATSAVLSAVDITLGLSDLTSLTVTTSGNVTLTGVDSLTYDRTSGNLTGSNAGGNLTFTTNGAITDGNGAAANLTASGLTLSAASGIDLDVLAGTLSATVTGAGGLNVQDQGGGLVVTLATTSDGDVALQALSGSLTVQSATAGGPHAMTLQADQSVLVSLARALNGTLTVQAGDQIQEQGADGSSDLTAVNLSLSASSGIGSSGKIEIDAQNLTAAVTGTGTLDLADLAGGLSATLVTTQNGALSLSAAGGDLTLVDVRSTGAFDVTATTVTSGDLLVGQVASPTRIQLTAADQILELLDDPTADLTAPTLQLQAVRGIGLGNNLDVAADNLSALVTGVGPLAVSDLAGGLFVSSALATDGIVRLLAKNGDLVAQSVTAGGAAHNVTLSTFGTGNVVVDDVVALDGTIGVNSAGQLREVDDDAGVDFSSKRVYVATQTGIRGLELETPTVTNATVAQVGDIDLHDLSGGLVVSNATTFDGAMTWRADGGPLTVTNAIVGGSGRDFTATAGDSLSVGRVSASGDRVILTATGAVLEAGSDAEPDVEATELTVNAAGLGAAGATIETTLVRLNATVTGTGRIVLLETDNLNVLSATTASGPINLRVTQGALTLTHVAAGGTGAVSATTVTGGSVFVDDLAAGGDITLSAIGVINEPATAMDPGTDLSTPGILTMDAGTGIGTTSALEIEAVRLAATVSGPGKIDLADGSGGLEVDNAVATSGSVSLTATGGILRANNVSGTSVTLTTVTSGAVQVDDVVATGALSITSAGNISEVGVDAGIDLKAGAASFLRANGGVISTSDALEVEITGGTLSVLAIAQVGGSSIRLGGTVNGSMSPTGNLIHLNSPPGTSKFNDISF